MNNCEYADHCRFLAGRIPSQDPCGNGTESMLAKLRVKCGYLADNSPNQNRSDSYSLETKNKFHCILWFASCSRFHVNYTPSAYELYGDTGGDDSGKSKVPCVSRNRLIFF